jgi:ABC-type antimicrobial peptide transport system permease subunit
MMNMKAKDPLENEPLINEDEADAAFEKKIPSTSVLGNLNVAFRYVLAETVKNKRNFFVGVITVFIVVFSISLLQNTVVNSPVLFLKLSEDTVGEFDLVMTPKSTAESQSFFLNATDAGLRLEKEPTVTGTAPRWLFLSKIVNTITQANSTTILLIIDSIREQEIGLGRGWNHPPLEGFQTHVSKNLLKQIGVAPNKDEKAALRFDAISILHTFSGSRQNEDDFVNSYLKSTMVGSTLNEIVEKYTGLNVSIPFLDQLTVIDALKFLNIGGLNNVTFNGTLSYEQVQALKNQFSVDVNLTVVDEIDEPHGKYPKALGNIAILEQSLVNELLIEAMTYVLELVDNETIWNTTWAKDLPFEQRELLKFLLPFAKQYTYIVRDFRDNFKLTDYALTSIAMYRDRFAAYMKTAQELNAEIIKWSNKVALALGLDYPASFSTPLIDTLSVVYYLRLFLDQLLLIIELFLVGVGMFLIYALLLSDVEAKVYECGMLRALGMEQYTLIELLGIQSLLFSIPAIALGLLASWLAFIPVRNELVSFTNAPIPLGLTAEAAGLATAIGFIMPLIALIGPIQSALSKTLRDALDLYHSSVNDTRVTFTKLANLGLSPVQTNSALLMVIFGFIIYYMIPYSFIFQQFALFFDIFVLILLGMLFGLSLLAMTIHGYVQKLSVNLLMWGKDRRVLKTLVTKNLWGHSRRNTKTAVLFTTCIAFIIFAGSIFLLQSQNLVDNVKAGLGSDINVMTFYTELALDEDNIRNYLDTQMAKPNSPVVGFTFYTFYLSDFPFMRETRISNLADFPTTKIFLFAAEENYLTYAFDRYLVISELDNSYTYPKTPNGRQDIIKSLYIDPYDHSQTNNTFIPPNIGTDPVPRATEWILDISNNETYTEVIDMLISESNRLPLSVDTTTPMILTLEYFTVKTTRRWETTKMYLLTKPRALVTKLPGFFFSSYSQTSKNSPVIISMDNYYKLMFRAFNSSYMRDEDFPEKPPKRTLLVKLKDDVSTEDREYIVNGIRNFLQSDQIIVSDTNELVKSTDIAVLVLNLFFDLIAVIVITICFFVLLVSFTSNITENAWEFGVLRAVGLTSFQVIRVYIYEAMSIILSSLILGTGLGMLVSATLTLQADLFTELAFEMRFPHLLFWSIVVMSLAVAVLGSWLPARKLAKKKIAAALKNK